MKRLRCKLRSLWVRVYGVRWDGHCWSLQCARCIDCGLTLKEKVDR